MKPPLPPSRFRPLPYAGWARLDGGLWTEMVRASNYEACWQALLDACRFSCDLLVRETGMDPNLDQRVR